MAVDPTIIDASGGAPAYSGADMRLGLILPLTMGAGASLGARSGVRPSGSGTDLLVQAQSSPNMTVKVNTGAAIAQGSISATQGPYGWALDTLTNLTIAASHATLDRTDLIVVRIRDANVDTSGNRDGNVVVVTGTNGGGIPALPTDATYLTLAQVSVVHAVTTITAGAITDKRVFTAALGGVLPFVSTARPTGIPDGQRGWETDTSLGYTYNTALTKWLRNPVTIAKVVDTSYTFQATLQDDPVLQFPVEANSTYAFDVVVGWIGPNTVNYQWAVRFPAAARVDMRRQSYVSGGLSFDFAQNLASSVGYNSASASAGDKLPNHLTGVLVTGATAGTFAYQACQGSSSATTVWTLRGSTLRYQQTA